MGTCALVWTQTVNTSTISASSLCDIYHNHPHLLLKLSDFRSSSFHYPLLHKNLKGTTLPTDAATANFRSCESATFIIVFMYYLTI